MDVLSEERRKQEKLTPSDSESKRAAKSAALVLFTNNIDFRNPLKNFG